MKIKELINGLVKTGLKPEWAKKIVSDSINHIIQNDSVESIDTIDGYMNTITLYDGTTLLREVVITYKLGIIVCKLTYPISSYHLQ